MLYARRNVPHLQPTGATFSVLFLLKDAVPKPVLIKYNEQRKKVLEKLKKDHTPEGRMTYQRVKLQMDEAFDDLLRRHQSQSHLLASAKYAQCVFDKIRKYDGLYYDLYSCTVLSNHVHMEVDLSLQLPDDWDGHSTPAGYVSLTKIVQLIKGGSSFEINKLRKQHGNPVWSDRFRDRFIRHRKHLMYAHRYTLNNPVAAKQVRRWQDHAFTYGVTVEELDALERRRVYPDERYWLSAYAAYKVALADGL